MSSFDQSGDIPGAPVFILTIDTEEEWNWEGALPRPPFSTENIKLIPEFQDFCKKLEIRPTYFVNHAVMDSAENVALLDEYFKANQCDIGAHLHPWCTPPIDEDISDFNSHAVNLPIGLFERKMRTLTERFILEFGEHPYSFRAGRWGINGQQLEILKSMGYLVDSSVRPFYSDTAFSYALAKTRPYWPSFSNLIDEDLTQTTLLEVPVSSGFNHSSFELLDRIYTKLSTTPISRFRMLGILWQLGIMRKITVTPEAHTKGDICRCIDMCISRGDRVINMFFHSSDLLPGATPYVQSNDEKNEFLSCLRHCVDYMRNKHGAEFLTMRQLRQRFHGAD